MKTIFLQLTIAFSAFPAFAALNVAPIVQKITDHSCAAALNGAPKPLLFIVGLGNYGYSDTRHNVGFDIVAHLADMVDAQSEELPEQWEDYLAPDSEAAERYMQYSGASSPRRNGLTVSYRIGGRVFIPSATSEFANIVFAQPYYDINESGFFVSQLAKDLNLLPKHFVVVVDDLTLDRNQVVLSVGKVDGAGDGHNGLKSINSLMERGDYFRLRVGISNPKKENASSEITRTDWVLGMVPDSDKEVLFSDARLTELKRLILNLQQRLVPDAHQGKLVAEGSTILKNINQN